MPLVAAWRDAPLWAVAAVAACTTPQARAQLGDRSALDRPGRPAALGRAARSCGSSSRARHRRAPAGAAPPDPARGHGAASAASPTTSSSDAARRRADRSGMPGRRAAGPALDHARSSVGPDGTELEHVDDHFHLADAAGATHRATRPGRPTSPCRHRGSRIWCWTTPATAGTGGRGGASRSPARCASTASCRRRRSRRWLGYVHAVVERSA